MLLIDQVWHLLACLSQSLILSKVELYVIFCQMHMSYTYIATFTKYNKRNSKILVRGNFSGVKKLKTVLKTSVTGNLALALILGHLAK